MTERPKWMQEVDKDHDSDRYGFEESDAKDLSDGKTGRTPGSGRLFPGQLDSEVLDFKTDNKVVGKSANGREWRNTKSYRIDRDFWIERIRKCEASGHNFRESILFTWLDRDREFQLHIVAVEGSVFKEIYGGYSDLMDILSGSKSVEEVRESRTKIENTPNWVDNAN